jgi:hypothetical protein
MHATQNHATQNQECAMNEFATKSPSQMDPSSMGEPVRSVADQAAAASRDVQHAAVDLANSSAEALKGHATELMDAAKGVAAQTGERLQDKMTEQKGAGADYVNNLADKMRRAAGEFDADIPVAGTYIRKAADQVENAADALRRGNLNDLVQGAQAFARNQPTAFLGLAVLAGFGAVRFLKSSYGLSHSGEQAPHAADDLWNTRQHGPSPTNVTG